jgi:hypothetical protein
MRHCSGNVIGVVTLANDQILPDDVLVKYNMSSRLCRSTQQPCVTSEYPSLCHYDLLIGG